MTSSDDSKDALAAALADRYALLDEIGRGGMATVYLARDLRHDSQVAIKVLRPDLALSLGGSRFSREVRITASLQHPNTLTVLDSGEAAGQPYFVMPFGMYTPSGATKPHGWYQVTLTESVAE